VSTSSPGPLRRVLRLTLLPFPTAVALSFATLVAVDHILRPDRRGIEAGGPAEFVGTIVVLFLTMLLQALWGVPSLLVLDRWRSGFSSYAAAGVASSVTLSFAFAALLRAPQFGETLLWMFAHALLFFGLPLLLSYILAGIIRPYATRKA
jgi:hypothetical protein